ncbi:MAG: DUF4163 domain-containing protein [Gloeobacterales cyanobacterium]
MNQKLLILSLVGPLFFLSTSSGIAQLDRKSQQIAQALPINAVQIKKLIWKKKSPKGYCEYQVEYPKVRGLSDKRVESKINEDIQEKLLISDKDIAECDRDNAPDSVESQEPSVREEVGYQVSFNGKDILSIEYERTNFFTGSVYGQPVQGITINTKTGKLYEYKDLFKKESGYVSKMNKLIYKKIKNPKNAEYARNLTKQENEDLANTFKDPISPFKKNERKCYSFSLRGDKLVILDIFNTHALRAIQVEFEPSEIKNLIDSKGPLHQIINQ